MLKGHGRVIRMGDDKRPQRILTNSKEERKGRPEVKWDRKANRVMKQKIQNT
jgi:hypothetical protein